MVFYCFLKKINNRKKYTKYLPRPWLWTADLRSSDYERRFPLVATAASEPEANERGSYLISRRLHYKDLQSFFLTKRKELWFCPNGRFRMRSGMRKELWLCANGKI